MKTFNKIASLFILCLLLGFVSCKEESPTWEPAPTPVSTQGVFFPTANQPAAVIELDPIDPTEFMVTISRKNTAGAVEVPITVIKNDGNIFVIPATVSFAAGVETTQFKVTFPDAEAGTTYQLILEVQGDQYIDLYGNISGAKTTTISTSLTRIKWDVVGPLIYIDGTFSAGWGVPGQYPQYVEAERTSKGELIIYRLKNVYNSLAMDEDDDGILDGFPWNDPGDFDEDNVYYTFLTVNTDNTVSMAAHDIGVDWGNGMMNIGSIYGNLSTNLASYPLGVKSGDVITFGASSLYYNQPSYASARTCGTPTIIYLTKAAYLATLEEE